MWMVHCFVDRDCDDYEIPERRNIGTIQSDYLEPKS
jgi:hypothetical protein